MASMMGRRGFLVSGAAAIGGASLISGLVHAAPGTAKTLNAVASFSILGDMVRMVAGERLALTVLVGPDGDAHAYDPGPKDVRALARAQIFFVNGLGFENWSARLIKASQTRARIAVLSEGVKVLKAKAAAQDGPEAEDHGDDHDHEHGEADPHAWQDPKNGALYVENVARALVNADPMGAEIYKANAFAAIQRLEALDADLKARFAALPAARRVIVTNHDAFAYFAKAYGLTFLSPQGLSTEAEATAGDVARLIVQIRKDKIAAVFVENISVPRLIAQIARETGAKIGGRLFSDALSPADGPASTYETMLRHNGDMILKALA